MSCSIYEEPRFNLAERRQADGGEHQVRHVDIYESGDGFAACQGPAAPRNQGPGARTQRPFPVNQRNRFRTALLPLVLLNFLLLLAVVVLSTLYIGVNQKKDLSAQTSSDQTLCQKGGNTVLVGDWTRFRCSCYYRSEEKRNWTESRRLCQNSGGDLVFIKNREENEFVKDLNGNRESWIGLYCQIEKWMCQWEWVDGAQLSYRQWRSGWVQNPKEPSAFISMDGLWNTANAELKYWICKRNL